MSHPRTVRLLGAQPSCAKIDAIKLVRQAAAWDLQSAKGTIDATLRGEEVVIPLTEGQTATKVAERFSDLGFIAEVDGQRYERPLDRPYVRRWDSQQVGAVQVTRVGAAEAEGVFPVRLQLVSGRLAAGDQIGIPLNDALLATASVIRTASEPGGVIAHLDGDAETAEFWEGMNVVGEVLPVLPPTDHEGAPPTRARRRSGIIALFVALLGLASLLGAAWWLHDSRTVQLWGGLVPRVETDQRVVALTFDDGPSAYATEAVLDTLARLGVTATFYVTGSELEQNPALGRRLVEAGHALGNHSFSHAPMVLRSTAFVRAEVERTDSLIHATGYDGPITFRPPYGKRLVVLPRYLHHTGRETLLWDVEPESYPEVAASAEAITDHVVERVRPGSIVLLHVVYPSRETSRQAVPRIVERLRADGYRFVTVPELLALRPEPASRPRP